MAAALKKGLRMQVQLITARQAADMLGVTPKTVWLWANTGIIPYVQLPGRNKKYDKRDIEALISKHKHRAKKTAL